MRYEWQGGMAKAVDVDVAVEELQRIQERDGGIGTQTVVDEARPDEALLHPAFEWRDEVAAEEWRRAQARQLVRAIVLVPEPEENRPVVRAFVSVRKDDDGPRAREYKPIEVISEGEKEQVLRRFRSSIRRLRDQYDDVRAYLGEEQREAFAVLSEV